VSELDEDPPEFGIEAGEDFVEGDIPSVPILTDFIPDLQLLAIEPSHEVSEETIQPLQHQNEDTDETSTEISSKHYQEETVEQNVEMEANAPPMFYEESASNAPPMLYEDLASNAPQFEVPAFEVTAHYPLLDVEASAPMFEEEHVSEAKEETFEDTSQENEATYAVIQPFTESQVFKNPWYYYHYRFMAIIIILLNLNKKIKGNIRKLSKFLHQQYSNDKMIIGSSNPH